ncbi:MAG TPA: prenyltransferase/squalene oxidase repeat-containing protein [Pirellulales bacterium]|jgi:geranylgeranyl transferase type-2 subunit beta|nr:prenyltransferase/squalene oxidase repeat-containing protein [Pirellulales bacterium]
MNYLEQLTLRLAEGVGQLPDSIRLRQANYVRGAQRPDGGFGGRQGASDLYYTGFALRSLAILGELHGLAAERAARFLTGQLSQRVAIVDFLSLVYGAALLERMAGLDVFAAAPAGWREAVAAQLERFRRADGGYARTEEGAASSTYYSFLMALCQQLIGRPPDDPQRLTDFVRSRQRADGGFVEMAPMQRSGTNPTAAAAGLLRLLGAINGSAPSIVDFLSDMQTDEGGLRANTRIPIADVLSTFTGLLTLADLGGSEQVDLAAARQYVMEMELPGGGFRGGLWDDGADVEYTFYGLGVLALAASPADA